MAKSKENVVLDKPELRVKVRVGGGAIGPGKIRLLELIDESGSISSAARHCGMDYRRAQYLLETLSDAMETTLVKTSIGGASGGGAELTADGRALIAAFHALQNSVRRAAIEDLLTIDQLHRRATDG